MNLEAQAKAKDDAIRPWLARAEAQVARRLADARAHAEAGRKPEALARVDELGEGLGGMLADARARFYRQAFAMHRPLPDPGIHRVDLGPHREAEIRAKTAPIGGRSQRADLAELVDDARAALRSILASPAGDKGPRLRSWERIHREAIAGRMAGSLSNAQIALFEAVGKILEKE